MTKNTYDEKIAKKIELAKKRAAKAKAKKAADEEAEKEARRKRIENAEHDIGYAKTPEHTRFKKGQPSANPGGRPKKTKKKKPNKSVTDIIEEEIYRLYSVNGEDLPAIRIMIRKHVIQGMGGDSRSSKFLDPYIKNYLNHSEEEISAEEEAEREENMAYIRKSLIALRDRIRMAGADENGLLPGESFGDKSRPPVLRNWDDWEKAEAEAEKKNNDKG